VRKAPRTVAALAICAVTSLSIVVLVGCGVPKSEHEKVVKELDEANQEKMVLIDQLDQASADNELASQKVTQLQSEVDALKKENEGLKVKLSPSKMAATQ